MAFNPTIRYALRLQHPKFQYSSLELAYEASVEETLHLFTIKDSALETLTESQKLNVAYAVAAIKVHQQAFTQGAISEEYFKDFRQSISSQVKDVLGE